MFGINDQYGPDDDRSLGLQVHQQVELRSTSGATHAGVVAAIGHYFVDVANDVARTRVRLSSIESVTWPAPTGPAGATR